MKESLNSLKAENMSELFNTFLSEEVRAKMSNFVTCTPFRIGDKDYNVLCLGKTFSYYEDDSHNLSRSLAIFAEMYSTLVMRGDIFFGCLAPCLKIDLIAFDADGHAINDEGIIISPMCEYKEGRKPFKKRFILVIYPLSKYTKDELNYRLNGDSHFVNDSDIFN